MALTKVSIRELDQKLGDFFSSEILEKLKGLSNKLFDNPTQDEEEPLLPMRELRYSKTLSLNEKILLLLSTWYCEENIAFQIRQDFEQHWGKEQREIYEIIISSKLLALGWLKSQDRWNEHDFFGNIMKKKQTEILIRKIKVWAPGFFKGKRYSGYCRGYKESASWTPHRSKSFDKKKFLTEKQFNERALVQSMKKFLLLRKVVDCIRTG